MYRLADPPCNFDKSSRDYSQIYQEILEGNLNQVNKQVYLIDQVLYLDRISSQNEERRYRFVREL